MVAISKEVMSGIKSWVGWLRKKVCVFVMRRKKEDGEELMRGGEHNTTER